MAKTSLRKKNSSRSRRAPKLKRKAKRIGRKGKISRPGARTSSRAKVSPRKARSTSKSASPARAYSIVRIMGKGQYKLGAQYMAKLNRIDNSIIKFVENQHDTNEARSQSEFLKQLNEMISLVEAKGVEVHPREIVSSDIILPFEDTTLEEAKDLFRGEGLVPE